MDASLWFFHAVHHYAEASGDWDFADDRDAAGSAGHPGRTTSPGTDYGIGVDPADGLLHAGQPGVQLTWMDAKVGDWVVTPRTGKPVEINALWHNALCVDRRPRRARRARTDAAADYGQRAAQVKASFAAAVLEPGDTLAV